MPTSYRQPDGNTAAGVNRKSTDDPAGSKTPSMPGSLLHGTWGILFVPGGDREGWGRQSRNPASDADEKSDTFIVPRNRPNNGDGPAEAVEGRGVAKGNVGQMPTHQTQSRRRMSMGLEGVREAIRGMTRGRSRMRQFRSYGSVRGADGNLRPYRDPQLFGCCPRLSPDASVRIAAREWGLLRYCARLRFALERIEQANEHQVIYDLSKPRRDGCTPLSLTPLEVIDQPAAVAAPPPPTGVRPATSVSRQPRRLRHRRRAGRRCGTMGSILLRAGTRWLSRNPRTSSTSRRSSSSSRRRFSGLRLCPRHPACISRNALA